ncbi:DUF4249 domain-containing protein [Ekhidna sp.]
MKIKNLLLALGIFFLLACEEEVPPPDFDEEEKLVVNSIISPFSEEIIVEVSVSRNAFGIIDGDFESDIVRDAIVTISDGTREVLIPFDDDQLHYSIPSFLFSLDEGKTFLLSVEANGESVYGETILPKRITELESVTLNQNNVLNVTWQDFTESDNYYRILATGFNSEFQFSENFFFESDEFISDTNRNGEVLSARGEGNEFATGGYDNVTVRIISSSSLYSDYFRILKNFVQDDPFADPVQLPSNIVGGIGIFEAVQVSEFTVEAP